MKRATNFRLVLVTTPNLTAARKLARGALTQRLIACANLLPGIRSHYRWRGKLESANEVLMILKTTEARLGRLERWLLAHHPYDTPEILALTPDTGTARYLDWLESGCVP